MVIVDEVDHVGAPLPGRRRETPEALHHRNVAATALAIDDDVELWDVNTFSEHGSNGDVNVSTA